MEGVYAAYWAGGLLVAGLARWTLLFSITRAMGPGALSGSGWQGGLLLLFVFWDVALFGGLSFAMAWRRARPGPCGR